MAPPAGPQKIDFVALDPATDSVVLVLGFDRLWTERGEELLALQDRLNAYLRYALDGQLWREHPAHRGKRVRIHVLCREPSPDGRRLLERSAEVARHEGVDLAVEVRDPG